MNNEITIYELFGLMKDGKAPDKIRFQDRDFYFDNFSYICVDDETVYLFRELLWDDVDIDLLDEKVKILPEEHDEWENIEEINLKNKKIHNPVHDNYLATNSKEKYIILPTINKLIKNQKKIIEKLEDK